MKKKMGKILAAVALTLTVMAASTPAIAQAKKPDLPPLPEKIELDKPWHGELGEIFRTNMMQYTYESFGGGCDADYKYFDYE